MTKLNKFQNLAFTLFRELYSIDGLTPTREMVTTALNNYLPRMEEVLKVTQFYKDKPRVIKFLEENKDLMNEVKIEENKLKEELKIAAKKDDEEWWDDSFGSDEMDFRSVEETVKSKSIKELEEFLSKELSNFYDGKINTRIDSFNKVSEHARNSIKIELVLGKSLA